MLTLIISAPKGLRQEDSHRFQTSQVYRVSKGEKKKKTLAVLMNFFLTWMCTCLENLRYKENTARSLGAQAARL